MKILYVHQYFGTPKGATGLRSYEFARALIGRGHEVLMVCGSADRQATGLSGPFTKGRRDGVVDGIQVVEFDVSYSNSDGVLARGWKFVRYALRAIGVALSAKYDVCFATSTPLTAALPGLAAKHLRGKPFVFEVRDLWPELPKALGMKNPLALFGMWVLEGWSYAAADRVIGLAPGIAEGIAKRGTKAEKITTIPNGCDLHLFDVAEPKRMDGPAEGDLTAIFAGAHGRANGLDAVIDAAAELKKRGRGDIKLVLIGQGSEKARLVAKAKELGLTNILFKDSIPKSDILGVIKGADIGLQILANVPAFYYGTSPNKFFDYIAAGIPVLNNYPGWLADLIAAEQCGFTVPPNDPVAFADALEKAAGDRSALKAMGAKSHALAKREFDRAKLAEQFVDVIEAVKPAA